ncbi:hypothetical protein ID866_4028 [Astraeus odoratus]|nr:hypothetical protein ID866_4028 [Astraeus odoratus]
MTRGLKYPQQTQLPKVSFTIVEDDVSTQPAGVHDLQARSYGYNDFSEFQKPDHYIRYIEPLERDLAIQVEYDMDEQDQEWLDGVNLERKRDQLNLVSPETFEIIMDRLEKEYFDLTKNIPKPDYAMPSEDSTCAICDDPEGENSNAIVFCDGCNLAVHQGVCACPGATIILAPDTRQIAMAFHTFPKVNGSVGNSCIFCPNEGGAFKQTVLGEWAHLLCAIWIPEIRVANEVFMEPISSSEKIPKQRWKLGSEPVTLTCYCEKHLPKEQAEARLKALAADGVTSSPNSKLSKSARAYAKTYKTGPPLVPQIIVDRILNYISKITIRKKTEFVYMVCKYWSLKREARRGAPLLKRLHLEPWTASNMGKVQTEEEKALKLEYLRRVRSDLEMLRELTLLSRKRESRKLAQLESIHRVLEFIMFPHEAPMRLAFEKILALDRNGLFKHPVSKTDVPDYYDVVKHPMNWDIIDAKLDHHEYWDLNAFRSDIELVLSNAILYNKPGTSFYKTAQRMQISIQPLLADLHPLVCRRPLTDGVLGLDADSRPTEPIGDLEPPIELVELLGSSEAIQNDFKFVLETEPLSSLFAFELGRVKPPPPPPPPKPKTQKKKKPPKVKAAEPSVLDISPGFRAPRTRRALAVAAAFEAEATGVVVDAQIVDATAGPSQKSKGRPKASGATGQLGVPQVVEDVDNQGSFKMFDAGWILPSGQKRGGRQPVDRTSLPPPKKRMRTDRGTSNLSTVSGAASEIPVPLNVAQLGITASPSGLSAEERVEIEIPASEESPMHEEIPTKEEPPVRYEFPIEAESPTQEPPIHEDVLVPEHIPVSEEAPVHEEVPMREDVLIQEASSIQEAPNQEVEPIRHEVPREGPLTQAELEARIATIPVEPHTKVIAERGRIIIEELDTPAIRKEKAQRKKAEKAAAAALTALANQRPTRVQKPPLEDSDLSSLSDLESEEGDVSQLENKVEQPNHAQPVEPGTAILEEGKMLEGGTLVWAKASTYPWWPAVVYEPDDERIPKTVKKTRDTVRRTEGGPLHLVQFFDKASQWQWVELRLDSELLAPNSRRQRWKTNSIRKDCRDAYQRAIAEMETETDMAPEAEGIKAESVAEADIGHVEVLVPLVIQELPPAQLHITR